ncbi:MAG: hypothetical protein Q8P51_01630 [Ignavibacteria bacterium]|nr:hypothetical protein [Ignavibacteria bacterium]
MQTTDHAENSNKPFSQRLIEDLKSILVASFLICGMRLDSIQMDPVDDDEELETVSGPVFVFTIRATALMCKPKGERPTKGS